MEKTEIILKILGVLIDKGVLTLKGLESNTKIPRKELSQPLRELEFLNVVNVRKGRVYLSSQAYSLLFDAIFASRGLEEYFKERLSSKAIKEVGSIPGFLVPILLLRAASPYLGLVLSELNQQKKVSIDQKKMQFLLEYFSPRKIDYTPLTSWKDIDFYFDEFYDLWIALNKELLNKIDVKKSAYGTIREEPHIRTKAVPDRGAPPRSTATSVPPVTIDPSLVESDKYFGIPENNLKKLFGVEESKDKTQLHRTQSKLPSNLLRIAEVEISISRMLSFIRKRKMRTEGLVVTIYHNALKWEFRGRKILVPPMYLLEDGIYIDEEADRQFSDKGKSNQVEYLLNCVEVSNQFREASEKTGGS